MQADRGQFAWPVIAGFLYAIESKQDENHIYI